MKRILVGLLLMAGVAAHAEYSSYFYWQVDENVADFSCLDVKQEVGTFMFPKPKDATFFKVIGVRKFK